MIQIQAPDGSLVQFPAGTSDDVITRVMRENYGGPEPAAAAPAAQPNTRMDRIATGAGDPFRGLEQIVSRVQAGSDGGMIGRALRRNPNINAVMEAGAAAVPMPTPAQVDERLRTRETQYQAGRAAAGDTGTDFWRMGGQVASTLPMAAAMPAGSGFVGATAAGAGQGAALAALQPVTSGNFADEKKQQVELGALLGAATGPLGYAVGRAIAPRVAPQVRELADAGVQMTPGQMAGGMARRAEDVAAAFPGVGETVRNARRASVESFNRAVASRVLRPLNTSVPDDVPAGRELIEYVGQTISQTYDDAISRAQPFAPDVRFARDLAKIGSDFLTPQSRAQFNSIVRDRVMSRLQSGGGTIDPATYQTIRSELGTLARGLTGSQSMAEREVGSAFRTLQSAFDDLLTRTNPAIAPQIRAANAAYTGFVRMSDAAGRVGAVDGVFTPAQFSNAVRAGDNSVRRGAYARGDAPLQDLSDAARNVLPAAVPDSGTPERMALMGLASGGASALGLISPLQLAGAAALYGAYTQPAQRAIQAAVMAPRGAATRAAGNAIAQSGGAVTVPLGSLLLSPPSP